MDRRQEPRPAGSKTSGMFAPDLFAFLDDLALNNDRDWFHENKSRYETSVRGPALRFVEAARPLLHERVSPHVRADSRPVGGSLFRLHRDTRFSKDKRPYKTHVGMHFPHVGAVSEFPRAAARGVREDVHRPGFYLHLEPGGSFVGAGLWHPPTDVLYRLRQAIVDDEEGWEAVRACGFELGGESLKRPPSGFSKTHPFIEDLMRKDFITSRAFTREDVCAPDFLRRWVEECRAMAPLVGFLCAALELPWG